MKNIKEIEKIFYNFDRLNEEYVDLPEVTESYREIEKLLTEKEESKAERIKILNLVNEATYYGEKQGFIYGFQYAVRLLIGE